MGHGPDFRSVAQTLLARDAHDPDAPLIRRRIVRTYERTAYHLQVLTLADADGRRQTLRVTDEHPFYRTAPAVGGSAGAPGWTPARSLAAGDEVLGDSGVLTVIANAGEAHRQGVKVYNLEVEQDHTYFVLAEHAPDGADAVWVHNADYTDGVTGTGRLAGAGNDRFRASALHQAGGTAVHESVPVYGTRGRAPTGTLAVEDGEAYLISGRGPGRDLSSLHDLVIQDHVEMHAAALMKRHQLSEATLFLNRNPCAGGLGCFDVLADALPDGTLLYVVSPSGRVTYYGGAL